MIRTIIFISHSFLALQLFGQCYPNHFAVSSYSSDSSKIKTHTSYYGNKKTKQYEITYGKGKLINATYYYKNGNVIPNSSFKNGNGKLNFFCFGMYPSKSSKLNGCYGNFIDGLPNGKFKCYVKGKLIEEYSYNNGMANGSCKKYTTKGILIEESNFLNDSLEGVQRTFTENGEPLLESYYKDHKLHGTSKVYFNGVLILERNYKYGLLDGDVITYNYSTCKIAKTEFYVQGKRK